MIPPKTSNLIIASSENWEKNNSLTYRKFRIILEHFYFLWVSNLNQSLLNKIKSQKIILKNKELCLKGFIPEIALPLVICTPQECSPYQNHRTWSFQEQVIGWQKSCRNMKLNWMNKSIILKDSPLHLFSTPNFSVVRPAIPCAVPWSGYMMTIPS